MFERLSENILAVNAVFFYHLLSQRHIVSDDIIHIEVNHIINELLFVHCPDENILVLPVNSIDKPFVDKGGFNAESIYRKGINVTVGNGADVGRADAGVNCFTRSIVG